MSDRSSILKKFKDAVNSKSGKTIGLACNMSSDDIPRLSTGSLNFDFALGGGVPIGRITIFRGPESSGKTTAALRVAAIAQNLCSNCLRPAKNIKVVEIGKDSETGDVEYETIGFCDCYKQGIFKPQPLAMEYSDREKGTMRQVEVEVIDDKTGEKKNKKMSAYDARLKKYEENSYEEYRIVFIDVERAIDLKWAKAVGLDPRRLVLVTPSTAEECIDLYDELMRTGTIDMFILDSIAAMTPSIEVTASTEESQMGIHARLVNKFIRKAASSISDVGRDFGFLPTQIWINQERVKMGVVFGDNSTIPGGMGQQFAASIIVKMWSGKWERDKWDNDLKKDFQIDIGKEVRIGYQIKKNKTAPSEAKGSFVMRVVGENKGRIEESKYIIDQARKYGLFRDEVESGNKKVWFVGNRKFDNKSSALAKLEEPEVCNVIKKELLKHMLKSINSM